MKTPSIKNHPTLTSFTYFIISFGFGMLLGKVVVYAWNHYCQPSDKISELKPIHKDSKIFTNVYIGKDYIIDVNNNMVIKDELTGKEYIVRPPYKIEH